MILPIVRLLLLPESDRFEVVIHCLLFHEEYFTYNELCNLMIFDKCTHLWNQDHTQDTKYFHHPLKFPQAPMQTIPPTPIIHLSPQAMTGLFSLTMD